jgi:SAM-dependent methyltransferase
MTDRANDWPPPTRVRSALARYLAGDGIELGPGHIPYPLPYPGVSVRYVDRWGPQQNAELFPELVDASFPKPDVVCDLDVDRLSAIGSSSLDFVIASDVLEHVAEPIGLLGDMHRVLKPSGIALVLLPDRRLTFDAPRDATPLEELIRKHVARRTSVADEEIISFLEKVHPEECRRLYEGTADERASILAAHRARSIHVHCWTEEEFADVVAYCIGELGHGWDFLDGLIADDEGPEGIEFGYVLRKEFQREERASAARRFEAVWSDWLADRREFHAERRALQGRLDTLSADLEHARAEVTAFRSRRVVRATDGVAELLRRTRASRRGLSVAQAPPPHDTANSAPDQTRGPASCP